MKPPKFETLYQWKEEYFLDSNDYDEQIFAIKQNNDEWGLFDYINLPLYDDGLYQGLQFIAAYLKEHPDKFTSKYESLFKHEFWGLFT